MGLTGSVAKKHSNILEELMSRLIHDNTVTNIGGVDEQVHS